MTRSVGALAAAGGAGANLRVGDSRLAQRLRRVVRMGRGGAAAAWPLVDLALRLWLAWTFLRHGVGLLAANGPLGVWVAADAGGLVTATVIVAAAGLLALGLLTRLAAVPLLIEAGSAALAMGSAEPAHCVALLLWFITVGAGPLSVDAAFEAGVERSALPLHAILRRAGTLLAAFGRPLVLLALRILMAAALVAAGTFAGDTVADLPGWMPSVATLPAAIAWPLAVTLVFGVATPAVAAVLIAANLVALALGAGPSAPFYVLSLLTLLLLRGGGAWSVDALLADRLAAMLDAPAWHDERLPHVVVVGAGFGGLAAVSGLKDARCRITVVDRRNYHLFQPLLYQVATCGLSPANIAMPIRELVRAQSNVRVVLGRVTGVDADAKRVSIGTSLLPYDHLVIATGARHAYFGNDHFEVVAPGLKKIDDATDIRRRLLLAFERAEQATDPDERAAELTFVIVGGGPTGVEMAGAVAELAKHGLRGEFRRLRPEEARVVLIEGGPRVLAAFPEPLSQVTRASLEALGVEVRTDARATDIDASGVTLGDTHLAARTVIWAAGVMASPAAKWLGAEADRAGRAMVGPRLEVPDTPDVFVIGDTAHAAAWEGRAVPGVAPAAKQQGAYVASVISARLCGSADPAPFVYRHAGNLATIGRAAAVADLGRIHLTGAVAWWFWGIVHVLFLAHVRQRVAVSSQWVWAYLTWRKSTRLITGNEG